MTLLYYDPFFLEHHTGSRHPERPERLLHVMRHLERAGLDVRCQRPHWEPIKTATLGLVHGPEYVSAVETFSARGGGRLEEDTVCSPASFDVARLAAGAVADAVARVVAGQDRQALCLVRPPGHHALTNAAMGFCLFNNVALGARTATGPLQLDRVLVVDFDVHHGNGTQAIFWDDPRVGFLSIHRWPFYPGSGSSEETGSGAGIGTTVNLPTEFGTSRLEYRDRFARGLEWLAAKIRPQLILVSAGFDAHRDDPVGSLGLEIEDFALLTATILDVADVYAGGRIVSVLEGGYNTGILAGSVEVHLAELLKRDERPATMSARTRRRNRRYRWRSVRTSCAGCAACAVWSQESAKAVRSGLSDRWNTVRAFCDGWHGGRAPSRSVRSEFSMAAWRARTIAPMT